MTLCLPESFTRTILDVSGEHGCAWIEQLPELLMEFARRWDLEIGPPYDLSYNYVAPATRRDGSQVVLKAGVPSLELSSEIAALTTYAGRGSVRLIEADAERGVMLLERLSPGTMLSSIADDEQATRIAAGVMRELRKHTAPSDHDFPSTADWAQGIRRLRSYYDRGTGPFPRRLVEEAETLFEELLDSQGPPVLLHGDLHHFNILLHLPSSPTAPSPPARPGAGPLSLRAIPPPSEWERGASTQVFRGEGGVWLAIDPKGLVGEAEYEVGALLRNPDPAALARPEAVNLQTRWIEILAEELGYDRTRLRNWAVAQGVLSGWWSVEDHGEVDEQWIACVERMAEVRF